MKLRIQRALNNVSTWSYAKMVLQAMTTEANLERIDSIQVASQQTPNTKIKSGKGLGFKKP